MNLNNLESMVFLILHKIWLVITL